MTTLIVDDDPFVIKLLTRQLSSLGVTDVQGHTVSSKALELIGTELPSIQLLFCDLQMPGVDGIEIVRNLAAVGYRGGLVLISGEDARILSAASELARVLKLNVLAALQKPITVAQLGNVLTKHAAMLATTAPAPRAPRRAYTGQDIADAISRDEIIVYAQPQVAFSDRRLVGVEMLARWQHPQDGLVFPDQFISAAESAGLMEEFTQSVLRASLRSTAAWAAGDLPPQVSVNISMGNLISTGLVELVEAELLHAGVPASQLTLEVTESRVMQNEAAALDVLLRLRLKRIGLSIDDFGTGHSSLAQLRDLPFTELKIDRGFVHGAALDLARGSICSASMLLAREIGLTVVAEGVEDQADWDYASHAGCDVAQGYFVARPMPPEKLPAWLTDWNAQR